MRGAFERHSRRNVVIVNIGYPSNVVIVNMSPYNGRLWRPHDARAPAAGRITMATSGRALVREAARTIRTDGVEAVTLRDVGRRLGVSRTALYRHFADKAALLAAVAREGFQALLTRVAGGLGCRRRWPSGIPGDGHGVHPVRQGEPGALPDHVRPVQGSLRQRRGARRRCVRVVPGTARRAGGARARRRHPRDGDRHALGHFIWASMHGVAMLSIDGQLGADPAAADALTRADGGSGQRSDCDATVASAFRRTSG